MGPDRYIPMHPLGSARTPPVVEVGGSPSVRDPDRKAALAGGRRAAGGVERPSRSSLEPTGERLPGLHRAFREAEEPQREALRVLIARVIREMHRSSTVSIEQTAMFEQSACRVESGRKSRVTIFEVCPVHSLTGGPVRNHESLQVGQDRGLWKYALGLY